MHFALFALLLCIRLALNLDTRFFRRAYLSFLPWSCKRLGWVVAGRVEMIRFFHFAALHLANRGGGGPFRHPSPRLCRSRSGLRAGRGILHFAFFAFLLCIRFSFFSWFGMEKEKHCHYYCHYYFLPEFLWDFD